MGEGAAPVSLVSDLFEGVFLAAAPACLGWGRLLKGKGFLVP